jgi:transposase
MSRRPLADITGNRASNCELSPYLRGQIDRSRSLGQSCEEIAKTLKLTPSTIYYTIDKSTQRNEGKNLLRSGRPKKYTERDTRRIVHFVRVNPKSTYEDIRRNLHIYLSHDTFGRILADVGIKNWRAKRRPFLTSEHAKIRRRWVKIYINWTTQWELIIFSDECSVERGAGGQRE